MAKSEKIFELLSYIKHCPHLSAKELAGLCDISERGVYRYLNTLQRAGIAVQLDNGYVLKRSLPVSDRFTRDELASVYDLLREGVRNCSDAKKKADAIRFLRHLREKLPAAKMSESLVIAHPSKPSCVNPATTYDTISANLMTLIFSSLLKLTPEGEIIPDLVKDWTTNGATWRFCLRKACFSDGTPLTGQDVAATYERLRASHERALRRKYGIIDAVNVQDDRVSIRLKHSYGPAACLWTRPIGKKELLQGQESLIGSGPFTASREGDAIVLERNTLYYGDVPELKRVTFSYVSTAAEALEAIKAGDVDIAIDLISPDVLNNAFWTYPLLDGTILTILFDGDIYDRESRAGIEHGLNKEVLLGKSELSYVPDGPFSAAWANCDVKRRHRNVEKVQRGKEFRLALTDAGQQLKQCAIGVKVQLMKAGVPVKLVTLQDERDAVLCRLLRGPDPGELGKSMSAFVDLPCNELWTIGRRAHDIETRRRAYQSIHKVMHDECRAIFLTAGYNYLTSRYRLDTRQLTLMDFIESLAHWRVSSSEAIPITN